MESGQGGIPFARLGFRDVFTDELGSQAQIMAAHGLTAENLARRAAELLETDLARPEEGVGEWASS